MSEAIYRDYTVERNFGMDNMKGIMIATLGAVTIYSVLGAIAFGAYHIFMA